MEFKVISSGEAFHSARTNQIYRGRYVSCRDALVNVQNNYYFYLQLYMQLEMFCISFTFLYPPYYLKYTTGFQYCLSSSVFQCLAGFLPLVNFAATEYFGKRHHFIPSSILYNSTPAHMDRLILSLCQRTRHQKPMSN